MFLEVLTPRVSTADGAPLTPVSLLDPHSATSVRGTTPLLVGLALAVVQVGAERVITKTRMPNQNEIDLYAANPRSPVPSKCREP